MQNRLKICDHIGVTLDSKLTWKPHITRITREATTAILQCRQKETYNVEKKRLVWLMISSAFLGTSNGALEILLNITPIEEFLLAEAVRGSYKITVSGLWHVNQVGSFGKTKSHVDVCNEARRLLPLLQMPAD